MDDRIPLWLSLARAPGVSTRTLARLARRFGDARSIVSAPSRALERCGLDRGAVHRLRRAPDAAEVESALAWLDGARRCVVVWESPLYPDRLRAIPDPPVALFVQGEAQCLDGPHVALVGSRRPTPGGAATAHRLARDLARAGIGIVSGLAYGIDAAAHRGALASGGITVAVAGCGPDVVYPARHRDLADRVVERGAVVTEFPPGTPPRGANFPRRNRIISGLSLGVVVVEAAMRSGSLITARLAAEQGREVLAVPGSVHSPLSRGCHALLRDGAALVEDARDVVAEVAPALRACLDHISTDCDDRAHAREERGLDDRERTVFCCLDHVPAAIDTVVDRSGLTPAVVSSILLNLELRGLAIRAPGGAFARAVKGST